MLLEIREFRNISLEVIAKHLLLTDTPHQLLVVSKRLSLNNINKYS
jgi:hypothetical protein